LGAFIFVVGLALVPTLFYILLLWWLDRYEKEPVSLLALAFIWGAVPSIIFALVFEILADYPLHMLSTGGDSGTGLADFVSVAVVGPFIEEGFKAVIVLTLFLAFRREFDDVLDGIIYGAIVGLGFAFVENIFYGLSALETGGLADVVVLAMLRSVLFGLNHALFTSVTGAGFGYARYVKGGGKFALPVLGFLGAWLLHGTHNALNSLGDLIGDGGCLGLLFSIGVDWTFVLGIVIVAGFAIRKERGWITQQLQEEVQVGRISPAEYYMLTSSLRRVGARWRALSSAGLAGYHWLGKLQGLATELAFRKQQVLVEHDPAWSHYDIQLLRARIDALKQQVPAGMVL
jgi:RsiW-degrading membrane proteinase PrsW (M82 family)